MRRFSLFLAQHDYMTHKNDAATYEFYKRHEEAVLTALAEGRKPPRRPKRSELMGILEYRALLERGMPRRDRTTARDESFLKEGLFPAEPVLPTRDTCNLELQERKRGKNEDVDLSDNEAAEGNNSQEEGGKEGGETATTTRLAEETFPRSRGDRRCRRNLILDEDDLMEAGSGLAGDPVSDAAAAGNKEGFSVAVPVAFPPEGSRREEEGTLMAAKGPTTAEAKREGEERSNLPTACCTGSAASHKDHRDAGDALDAQHVKGEVDTCGSLAEEKGPVGEAAAAEGLKDREGDVKQQSPSSVGEGIEPKSSSGKSTKGDDPNAPRIQRLLIFTQFQLVLDELEAYCKYRGWRYLR